RVNGYKNRPKPNINPPDDNSEQSVDELSESFKYTTEEDNISDLESTIDNQILWILLWIMIFWTRFNITETAIEALIKFMKLVLTEIGEDNFRDFPDSMYLTRKKLGLKDHFHSFVS
ncbi:66_t:CDS:2, partial [Funneliformis geosporum]